MTQTTAPCVKVPQFDRLTYFYGQMLHARDLQGEQAYFREKLKLHNHCLHGWGVVCGLEVTPPPVDPDCVPVTDTDYTRIKAGLDEKQRALSAATDDATRNTLKADIELLRRQLAMVGPPSDCTPANPRTKVQIGCGLAIDCDGNELVVRQPVAIDLWATLSADDRGQIDAGGTKTLYVGICYRECPIDPVRPVVPDACGATSECNFGKMRDSVRVAVTVDGERWKDERCDSCCEPCSAGCVLLARIDDFVKGQPLALTQIHPEVRRVLSVRPTTRITGINWVQGGTYTPAQAVALLGTGNPNAGGLQIRFSRPLRSETIVPGTIDVWVIEGGRGRAAGIFNKAGVLVPAAAGATATDTIVYRDDTGESLNDGDRVLVTLRSAFLLDDCCYPVDGAHVGGRVPLLPDSPPATTTPTLTVCLTPPGSVGPWMSGTGAGSVTNFESWFWIGKP
jgi:hypothetical protein